MASGYCAQKASRNNVKLWTAIFPVRPTPEHPGYWDIQYGYLVIWLFDIDAHNASHRACLILKDLPYDTANGKMVIDSANPFAGTEMDHSFQQGEADAELTGFGLQLFAVRTGEDDPFANESARTNHP
jgi:hypothetical protein